jgi:hypothetical protein
MISNLQSVERRLLARVQHDLAERAAHVARARGACSLPPVAAAIEAYKAEAAAALGALPAPPLPAALPSAAAAVAADVEQRRQAEQGPLRTEVEALARSVHALAAQVHSLTERKVALGWRGEREAGHATTTITPAVEDPVESPGAAIAAPSGSGWGPSRSAPLNGGEPLHDSLGGDQPQSQQPRPRTSEAWPSSSYPSGRHASEGAGVGHVIQSPAAWAASALKRPPWHKTLRGDAAPSTSTEGCPQGAAPALADPAQGQPQGQPLAAAAFIERSAGGGGAGLLEAGIAAPDGPPTSSSLDRSRTHEDTATPGANDNAGLEGKENLCGASQLSGGGTSLPVSQNTLPLTQPAVGCEAPGDGSGQEQGLGIQRGNGGLAVEEEKVGATRAVPLAPAVHESQRDSTSPASRKAGGVDAVDADNNNSADDAPAAGDSGKESGAGAEASGGEATPVPSQQAPSSKRASPLPGQGPVQKRSRFAPPGPESTPMVLPPVGGAVQEPPSAELELGWGRGAPPPCETPLSWGGSPFLPATGATPRTCGSLQGPGTTVVVMAAAAAAELPPPAQSEPRCRVLAGAGGGEEEETPRRGSSNPGTGGRS